MRPPKNLGNTALAWLLKLLNRIRALPQNLALGMKTHIGSCDWIRNLQNCITTGMPECGKT